jgi:cyclic-di-GMP phosphodiesterase TipF (flagellum assembly factor)
LAGILGCLSAIVLVWAWDAPWSTGASLSFALLAALAAGAAIPKAQQVEAPPRGERDDETIVAALDEVLQRLNAMEARLADVERHGSAGTRSNLTELTAEIGLLGGLMKDIAETVASHDERLGEGKGAKPEAGDGAARETAERRAPRRVAEKAVAPALAMDEAAASRASAPVKAEPAGRSAAFTDASVETEQGLFEPRDDERRDTPPPETVKHDEARDNVIAAAIRADQLEIHLQPVVSLPQRKAMLYEALGRVRIDAFELLAPAEFLDVAERRGLSASLDERVVARTLKIARHLSRSGAASVACNISPVAVAQPGFLRVLLRLAESDAETIARLIFELPQRTFRTLDAERSGALAALVDKGVRLSMDRVQDLRLDPVLLADKGVRFVKIPAAMLLGDGSGVAAEIHPADIPAMLKRADISLVAEKVENEVTVAELLDLNVPLAQGFLFGAPRPVRAEVYAAGAAAPAKPAGAAKPGSAAKPVAEPAPPEPAPVAPDRRPFRTFLRRAGA